MAILRANQGETSGGALCGECLEELSAMPDKLYKPDASPEKVGMFLWLVLEGSVDLVSRLIASRIQKVALVIPFINLLPS